MLKYELNRYESYNKIQNLIDKLPPRKYNISDLEIWLDPLDATQEYTGNHYNHLFVNFFLIVNLQIKFLNLIV